MKKICYALSVAALCALALSGCRREDIRPMTISLPGVENADDCRAVIETVCRLPGIQVATVHFDEKKRELRLMHDSMQIRRKNVEIAIAEIGFDANEIPAIPAAAK